ncbi:MAG: hypothetical protein AAFV53_01100 [Myxococcota bacterium]
MTRSPGPSLVDRLQTAAPLAVPRLLVQEGHSIDAIAYAAACMAALRCVSDSVDGLGSVSHALLGVAAARNLCAGQPPARSVPLLQAAWFVAREAQHSPYVSTPYQLPEPGSPTVALSAALAAGDVEGADAWTAAHPDTAAPHLAEAATASLGHLGHRAIFVAGVRALGGGPLLWRAAARYLASDASVDDTDARIEEALGPNRFPRSDDNEAIRAAQALRDGISPSRVVRQLLGHVTERLAAMETVSFSALHMVTAIRAVGALLSMHPDPRRATLAAAAWVDRFEEGTTELGPLSRRARPLAARNGTAAKLKAAIQGWDPEAAGALAQTVSFDPALRAWLADRAAHSGVATVQHSMKLLASVPDTPAGRSVACRYLARSYVDFEPELEPLTDLLTAS